MGLFDFFKRKKNNDKNVHQELVEAVSRYLNSIEAEKTEESKTQKKEPASL